MVQKGRFLLSRQTKKTRKNKYHHHRHHHRSNKKSVSSWNGRRLLVPQVYVAVQYFCMCPENGGWDGAETFAVSSVICYHKDEDWLRWMDAWPRNLFKMVKEIECDSLSLRQRVVWEKDFCMWRYSCSQLPN